MDLKLEVVAIPTSDVDAAKAFYTEKVGFNLDHDVRPSEGMRVVQMTPPGSACPVVIGESLPLGEAGSVKGVQLVVDDIDVVR
jgi:catechol 2,3-dioxygenase-like lactoylglutathione lyase family enzyme